MPHSLVNVFVHFVWITKKRERVLTSELSDLVKEHIAENAKKNSIEIVTLAVQPEHVHLLSSLSRSQRIEDIPKLLKGESSHWINQGNLLRSKFSWGRGYWAESVCRNRVDRVKAYIENQRKHHRHKSFQEEFVQMLRDAGYSDAEILAFLREADS